MTDKKATHSQEETISSQALRVERRDQDQQWQDRIDYFYHLWDRAHEPNCEDANLLLHWAKSLAVGMFLETIRRIAMEPRWKHILVTWQSEAPGRHGKAVEVGQDKDGIWCLLDHRSWPTEVYFETETEAIAYCKYLLSEIKQESTNT